MAGWGSAANGVDIWKVIGWCDGRMGGWRFVEGLA
jgi:hypothetical protein